MNRRKNKLGCLPPSAFFYAIELGTKIEEDVLARIRIEAKENIKEKIRNKFKSNPLPMHGKLVRK